jgi:ribosomal protein S18 acetylase RimI-like enzyme
MNREYPDAVAGPFDPPPREFADGEGREIAVHAYGEGPAEDEFGALVEMYEQYDPDDRAQGIPPAKPEAVRDWLESILGEDCHNVVAWDGAAVVGHATLVPDRHGAYELAIFVAGDYQGGGIGTELMERLLGLGRERGVERVWLTVERWNEPAIALYERVGFERTTDGGFEIEMAARLS